MGCSDMDLVDREALYMIFFNVLLTNSSKAPTVEAEPVRYGKWIPIIDEPHTLRSFAMLTGYKCSECGRRKSNEEPYCSCGAKMKGVQ